MIILNSMEILKILFQFPLLDVAPNTSKVFIADFQRPATTRMINNWDNYGCSPLKSQIW